MGNFGFISIDAIMKELNRSYFLPDIQREYVWLDNKKDKKIEQLFHSILEGYPIGSFLFWKLKKDDIETDEDTKEDSEKLNFKLYKFIENYDEREPHNVKINIEQINSDNLSIVLDGQQRLTSLYIGLKGTRKFKKKHYPFEQSSSYEEKQLFLNLRYQPKEEDTDLKFGFDFFTKGVSLKIDNENYWFRVSKILDLENIISYAKENNLSESEEEILKKLKDAICKKKLISYFEASEKSLERVLNIFIRTNSSGIKLSYPDLLMSILTANFSSDIRSLMNEFVDSLRGAGFERMGRDQVLKTCLILTESNHIFQLKNFKKNNINKIEENWKVIKGAILQACGLLKEFGYSDNKLSSAYILSIIAYYIFKNKPLHQEDKNELLKFVRNAQIKSYFTGSTDRKLEVVANFIRNEDHFESVNNQLAVSEVYPLKISSYDIDGMKDWEYGNPAILPILQILYPNLDYKNSEFHIDHIYPKSKFFKNDSWLADYLYNLQLLEESENIKKGAKDPEKWLEQYFLNDKDKIKDYKEKNYIKSDLYLDWSKTTVHEFCKYREKKIKSKLKEILLTEKEISEAIDNQ